MSPSCIPAPFIQVSVDTIDAACVSPHTIATSQCASLCAWAKQGFMQHPSCRLFSLRNKRWRRHLNLPHKTLLRKGRYQTENWIFAPSPTPPTSTGRGGCAEVERTTPRRLPAAGAITHSIVQSAITSQDETPAAGGRTGGTGADCRCREVLASGAGWPETRQWLGSYLLRPSILGIFCEH